MKKVFFISLLFISFLSIQDANSQRLDNTVPNMASEVGVKSPLKATIDVFPNPAIDYIIVEIKNERKIMSPVFELYSLIGTSVKITPEPISQNQYKIPVSHVKRGYHFIVVKDEVTRVKIAHKFLKN